MASPGRESPRCFQGKNIMKKKPKKLTLSRETVLSLEKPELTRAEGGVQGIGTTLCWETSRGPIPCFC
jgi:hypothetical protein